MLKTAFTYDFYSICTCVLRYSYRELDDIFFWHIAFTLEVLLTHRFKKEFLHCSFYAASTFASSMLRITDFLMHICACEK